MKMSKKTIKNKKITKPTMISKPKSASKKANKGKIVKVKPLEKTAKKKLEKKTVKKKSALKKVIKPVKKIISQKSNSKPKLAINKKIIVASKPFKKDIEKKAISKPVPSKKIEFSKKELTTSKKNKAEKTITLIEPAIKAVEPKTSSPFNSFKSKPKRRKGGRKRKNKNDDDEPEILHDELVEQLIRSTKKLRSQPKKPRILKTFTNPMASLTVALPTNENKKTSSIPKKEPKGKFTLEYVVHTSVGILYEFLTSPSGLMEWFADDVSIHDGVFTFIWEGSAQKAKLIGFKENQYVRLQWLDKPEGTYFEFRIQIDTLTSDVSLIITDFADEVSEIDTSKRLWDSQIERLLQVIGSY